jgi:hypothetical protein
MVPRKPRKKERDEAAAGKAPYQRSDFLRDLKKVSRRLVERDRDERSPRES